MNKEHNRSVTWAGRKRSVTWAGRTLSLMLVLALVLPTLVVTSGIPAASAASPELMAIASSQPDATVRVIAQTNDLIAAREQVTELGGTVTKDLPIINAFAAEMAAEAAVQLAGYPAVRWVSLDGPVAESGKPPKDDGSSAPTTTNTYLDTLGVRDVWAMGYDGQGIGIAVIDSGINHTDVDSTVVVEVPFNTNGTVTDFAGHGTHVAGIIAGSGASSKGDYAGIAPGASLFALNVSHYNGMAYESDVVAAMQWVYDNKDAHNIRVVNLSINANAAGSYHESAMNAAAEILWFNGIVVVVSAGNSGTEAQIDTITAAPANDPFFITVGATDESGTARRQDDNIPTFSASGWTLDGHWKPDVFAPGVDIISSLSTGSMWDYQYPERAITTRTQGQDYSYFRASGTSMSAPMVSGAVALLLQAEPNLTPDQVKYRLNWAATSINGYAYLDVENALTSATSYAANTGLQASQLLWSGDDPVAWDSVSWNSVSWNSVSWNSVSWNSVSWNSVSWNSVSWTD